MKKPLPGWGAKIVVDRGTNAIVSGHHRVAALKALGRPVTADMIEYVGEQERRP